MSNVAKDARKRLVTPDGVVEMEPIGGGHYLEPSAANDYRLAQGELPELDMRLAGAYRDPRHNKTLQRVWDSGDKAAIAKAGLKFRPSSTSDHLYGRAVDQSPAFHGEGELLHKYLDVMARHGYYYDTHGDPVHLGYYADRDMKPDKSEVVRKLYQDLEDRAGYGSYEGWKAQNKVEDAPDYDYPMAFANHAMRDENGFFSDIGKKPSHITYSDESAFSGVDGNPVGGHWSDYGDKTIFRAQPVNIANAGGEQKLYDYFGRKEPDAGLTLPELDQVELDAAGGGPPTSLANPITLQQTRDEQAEMNRIAAKVKGRNGR